MVKRRAILCDCVAEEIQDFCDGLRQKDGDFVIESSVSNWGRTSKLSNLKRYLAYFYVPWKIFRKRKQYEVIMGWQQFYALIFCWYELIFHVPKSGTVIALNFTYKKKNGIIGKLYYRFMRSICTSGYLDYIHVLSEEYGRICTESLGIDKHKIWVVPFGVPDIYDTYKESSVEEENYALALGRSNRDYDFLVKEWGAITGGHEKLIIITDEWKLKGALPENVKLMDHISGVQQYPYIRNCKYMILPIADGTICSGDTVLLTAMSFEKAVIVTKPSTLAEMYIEDGVNGILMEKKTGELGKKITMYQDKFGDIGIRARKVYLERYSRYAFGEKIGRLTLVT